MPYAFADFFYFSGGDGPVIQYSSNGEPVLFGMHSSVASCGEPSEPEVNVRVAALADFFPPEGETTTDVVQSNGEDEFLLGAVIGGVIAGVLVLLADIIVLWCVCCRGGKKKNEEKHTSTDYKPFPASTSLDLNVQNTDGQDALYTTNSNPTLLPLPVVLAPSLHEPAPDSFGQPNSDGLSSTQQPRSLPSSLPLA